uniref:C-type lectin domain-containing protein n=1 Tax=Strigops habroptila TaxID=2489341 RepID=A0A672V7Y6_STRHB
MEHLPLLWATRSSASPPSPLPTASNCFHSIPIASHCLPNASLCFPLLSHCLPLPPIASHCFPLPPNAFHCLLLFPTAFHGPSLCLCPDWQVTRSLRDASREHAAEQGRLEQELSAREQRLEQARLELAWARAELGRAWRDGNSSRAALELQDMEMGRARQELAELHKDMQRLQGQLSSSESTVASLRACVNTGRACCPSGWVLYRGKCLFISVELKTWGDSHRDCQEKSAQLLVQGDWPSWTVPVHSRGAAAPQGWGRWWEHGDGTSHVFLPSWNSWMCAVIPFGKVDSCYRWRKLPWICEKLPDLSSTSETVLPLLSKW